MRFKSPLIAVSAVSMLALSACGGSGSSSGQAGPTDNKSLGNTGNFTDVNAKGPVSISGAQKGGTVTVSTPPVASFDDVTNCWDAVNRITVGTEEPGQSPPTNVTDSIVPGFTLVAGSTRSRKRDMTVTGTPG